ncbi:MAG: hypothetical protein GX575_31505 [Candidatus Anammoximicrobium sp.]|nr:hypothetical protein [Candidatus Anammoximicrobium sp.]
MSDDYPKPVARPEETSRREFLERSARIAAAAALAGAPAAGLAAEENKENAGDNWAGPPVWPPFEKVEAVLKHWAEAHADRLRLDVLGHSAQGRALYAVRLTDPTVGDADKEHALITALHAGLERSGSNTVLSIIEWLLSDEPVACEILRRQIVVALPIPAPDQYEAGQWTSVYNAWTLDGPRDPERSPEAVAVQRVMDQYQPEVHADIHGTNLNFARYIMFENSGASYSNVALRPYHRDIIRQMDEAALAEGYGSDTAECDAERVFWGPDVDSMRSKAWLGRARIYAAIYCYYRYHTLVSASEVGWERSGVLRHRRLLQIGNETWPGEYAAGYPTRVLMSNTHAQLTAYGVTAAARRASRVELWNKLPQLTLGIVDPVVEGRATCACATSPAAARRWLSGRSLAAVVESLRSHPRMNAAAIAEFAAGWPAGQNHPEAYLGLQSGAADQGTSPIGGPGAVVPATDSSLIKNGLCLRLRLPYSKARILDLRLNGYPVHASAADGFVEWSARGCRFIQLNLSPARLQTDDLFLVTCRYDPGEQREHWDTWRRLGK